ncbi:hypothetical protein [Roseiflexus castenholzii]|uniref:hypothetical protein n=1 Tax=Roseiflexus castenholzii TaxID=120962 RepID=UPI0018DE64FD|nr:hypothetical protein [Roseiflexus castenholzii]
MSSARLRQMGAASRQRAERMSWEAVAQQYLPMFEQLASKTARQRAVSAANVLQYSHARSARRRHDDDACDYAGGGPRPTAAAGVSAGL